MLLNRRSINPIKKRTIRHKYQSVANRVRAQYIGVNNSNKLSYLKMPMQGIDNKIYVNPQKINKVSISGNSFTKANYLFVSGDWDAHARDIVEYEENDIRYITCRELLCGCDITETTEFKNYLEKANKGVLDRHFTKKEDIKSYLIQLNSMYSKIFWNNCLDENKMSDPISGRINVSVDREGNILLQRNGHHRVAVARYIKIDRVPVYLRQLHSSLAECITKDGSTKDLLRDVNSLIRNIESDNS